MKSVSLANLSCNIKVTKQHKKYFNNFNMMLHSHLQKHIFLRIVDNYIIKYRHFPLFLIVKPCLILGVNKLQGKNSHLRQSISHFHSQIFIATFKLDLKILNSLSEMQV